MIPANARPQSLQLIRLSLFAGVLMFGAVTLVVHRQPSWKPGVFPPMLGYVLVAYAIVAVSITLLLKGRVERESDPERRAAFLVAGWALGEGAGLFGAVLFYLSGQGQWYVFGLLTMVCAFVLLRPGTGALGAGSLDSHQSTIRHS